MGAIIGATYAYGYTGAQIEELVLQFPLQDVFGGYQPELPAPLDHLPVFVLLTQENGGSLHLEAPMAKQDLAEKLLRTALPNKSQTGSVSFSDLDIPLHVIASDLETREAVALSSGDLTQAVLASSAIPIVLPPVRIDGRFLVDGGLSDNIPVQTARKLGGERMIISDVADRLERGTLDYESPTDMAKALTYFLFGQDDYEVGPEDMLVRPDLRDQPKLDFGRKQKKALIQIGYEAGVESLKSARCLPSAQQNTPPARTAKAALAHQSFPVFGPVEGVPGQGPFSPEGLHEFTREDDDSHSDFAYGGPFSLAASGMRTGTSDPKPRAARTLPPSEIVVTAKGIPIGSRFVGASGNYVHEQGATGWIGWIDSGFLGDRATAAGVGVLGRQEKSLELSLRGMTDQTSGIWPYLSGTIREHRIRHFGDSGNQLATTDVLSVSGSFGPEARFGRHWTVRSGLKVEAWNDPGTSGSKWSTGVELVVEKAVPDEEKLRLEATWATEYTRLAAEAEWPFEVGNGRLTPGVRFGQGRGLPTQMAFALGGSLGFPGLHPGENRGYREALVRLKADYPFLGPFRIHGEVDYGLTDGGPWVRSVEKALLGVQAGLVLDTLLGPIHFGYGMTHTGRGAWVLRIGEVW
jgi:predicted acylesterase/phospholipase RssA